MTFIKLTRKFTDKHIVARVYVYLNGRSKQSVKKYWKEILTVDEIVIYEQRISSASQQKSKNKLLYGTVHLQVNSTELLMKVLGGIKKLGV